MKHFITLINLMALLLRPSVAYERRKRYDDSDDEPYDDGGLARNTVHEQLGQLHFPPAGFTVYRSNANYTQNVNYSIELVEPLFNLTQYIFDNIILRDFTMPTGYIVVKEQDTLALGPKVEANDWTALLVRYWVAILWVAFLLALIIVMPCIAVCYCCSCCWVRDAKRDPPTDNKKDAWKRSCWAILLGFLIIEILVAVLMAFHCNRLLKLGLDYSAETMRRSSQDTCTFLRDINSHVDHLFVKNYEELDFHLTDILKNAHTHMYLDLMDVSEANAVFEIERILTNIPEAQKLLEQVDNLETELRFYGAQLRDGVRGVKRDLIYACNVLCGNKDCHALLMTVEVQNLDTSICLHFDELPDTLLYLDATDEVIDMLDLNFISEIIDRLQPFEKYIKAAIDPITPAITRDLHNGEGVFREQGKLIRNTVNAVISDIELNTLRSTKSFDDLNNRFGTGRHTINVIICIIISVILVVLLIALICGCCAPFQGAHRAIICSRGGSSHFLLIAIFMIFCMYSLTLIVGLFYFIFGMLTYQGACEPLRDYKTNHFFRQLDADININRYAPKSLLKSNTALPPLRMSTALKACHKDHSIFKLLEEKHVYNIEKLVRTEVIGEYDIPETPIFPKNISKFELITDDVYFALEDIWLTNLSSFRSKDYTDLYCTQLTPIELPKLAKQIMDLESTLQSRFGYYDIAKIALYNEAFQLQSLHDQFVAKIESLINDIKQNLKKVDELILYNGHPFGESLKILEKAAERAEVYMRDSAENYARELRENLSYFVRDEVDDYIDMVIRKSRNSVGKCAPLSYIYGRSVDWICQRLVDPMNGFWFSIQLCCILFIPTLLACHQLVCLYRKKYRPRVLPRFVTYDSSYTLPVVEEPFIAPATTNRVPKVMTKEVVKKIVRFNIVEETNTDDMPAPSKPKPKQD